jgi:uncharacterized protein (DUF1778 family)
MTMNLARSESSGRRAERLEARVTADQKRLLQEAAALQGRTLSDFVVGSLVETAKRVLQERDLVVLSTKDREVFVRALLNPPTRKGGRLARAVDRYRRARK